jgi:hypothetical protein
MKELLRKRGDVTGVDGVSCIYQKKQPFVTYTLAKKKKKQKRKTDGRQIQL